VARAWNVGIRQAIIESNARGLEEQLAVSMMEHHIDVVAMVETLLQYLGAILSWHLMEQERSFPIGDNSATLMRECFHDQGRVNKSPEAFAPALTKW
jgi:hypothetical protein